MAVVSTILLLVFFTTSYCQRITTIQLDGVQYFVSRMNPYSPELNFFLAYQYCRSLGLQLASFETREKADSIAQYLTNAGYNKFDFWTSGNNLGTDMFLWMSTGLPFNATFNYMKKPLNENTSDIPSGSTSPQRTARESGDSDSLHSCVALKAPSFEWDTDYCTAVKDFISQGKPAFTVTTTTKPYISSSPTLPEKKNLFVSQEINKFLPKYRRTAQKIDNVEIVRTSKENSDFDQSTNGPYEKNIYSNVNLQDDPSAIVDESQARTGDDQDYVSTIEPDVGTASARYSYGPSTNNK
ncbi:Lectin C-type domain [Popillia japonica]|uniref:Lectin C-type domain n=1 Tax=Popillia japonica TaxID=7064 RepID=A0AAW1NJJ6_POPJA